MPDATGGAENGATLAFCEPVNATVRSREHIRVVGSEGFKYGGGIPNAALCGADVRRGWDTHRPVHPNRFEPDAETNPTCQGCIAAYWARVIPPGSSDPSEATS